MDVLVHSVFVIFSLSPLTLLPSPSMYISFPPYLDLILLYEAMEGRKRRLVQTLFNSTPKLGELTQIQPNQI